MGVLDPVLVGVRAPRGVRVPVDGVADGVMRPLIGQRPSTCCDVGVVARPLLLPLVLPFTGPGLLPRGGLGLFARSAGLSDVWRVRGVDVCVGVDMVGAVPLRIGELCTLPLEPKNHRTKRQNSLPQIPNINVLQ